MTNRHEMEERAVRLGWAVTVVHVSDGWLLRMTRRSRTVLALFGPDDSFEVLSGPKMNIQQVNDYLTAWGAQ